MNMKKQNGSTLLVSIIVLLLLALLGLSSVRNLLYQESMVTASNDRSITFQTAEAALRTGEAAADAQSKIMNGLTPNPNAGFLQNGSATEKGGEPTTGVTETTCDAANDTYFSAASYCQNGLCQTPPSVCTLNRWEASTFTGWVNGEAVSTLSGTPQYFVEYLGADFPCDNVHTNVGNVCKRYRITARSNPGTGRSTVMLQSLYSTE